MIYHKIRNLLNHILGEVTAPDGGSTSIDDQTIIEAFIANPNNTFFVSFPRTGSHWLRMVMELYFGRPSLVRVFYYPDRRDYLTLHTHDLELEVVRSHVIYLYRDPVDTIYSQLQYHKEKIDDRKRIAYWSDLYGRHLNKWLHQEMFTKRKTIVRYERLKVNMPEEYGKICAHFDWTLDTESLEEVTAHVSRDRVKEKTPHDSQVINLTQLYADERQRFRLEQGEFVWQIILHGREHLRQDF